MSGLYTYSLVVLGVIHGKRGKYGYNGESIALLFSSMLTASAIKVYCKIPTKIDLSHLSTPKLLVSGILSFTCIYTAGYSVGMSIQED